MSHDHSPHAWRPTLRLARYDYAQPGAYVITICTLGRVCRFGTVEDGQMHLNDAGRMVSEVWEDLPQRFPHISLDVFVTMPNHIHGIILIQEERADRGLGQMVGAYKSLTTHRYILGVRQAGWPRFSGRLWQDNYFEHVIRSEEALQRIREYIVGNPVQWGSDPERPPG